MTRFASVDCPALPLITDPWFYIVAVPAVLLLGISKSGFCAGFGSLAVPMMALAVSVPQAAAILMPVLLLMDLLGMAAFRKNFDRRRYVYIQDENAEWQAFIKGGLEDIRPENSSRRWHTASSTPPDAGLISQEFGTHAAAPRTPAYPCSLS